MFFVNFDIIQDPFTSSEPGPPPTQNLQTQGPNHSPFPSLSPPPDTCVLARTATALAPGHLAGARDLVERHRALEQLRRGAEPLLGAEPGAFAARSVRRGSVPPWGGSFGKRERGGAGGHMDTTWEVPLWEMRALNMRGGTVAWGMWV